ncbi:MAG: chromosomal replication initiator protein DnaA [Phycisphaerales bacterium]|nr:chromosomal replication initiator protein DnaA [Phycisphaerales bacterium]
MNVRASDVVSSLASVLTEKIGPQRFSLWFKNVTRFEITGDYLRVWVANPFIGEWVERHFTEALLESAREVTGQVLRLTFTIDPALAAAAGRKQPDRQAEFIATNPEREARHPRGTNGCVPPQRLPGRLDDFIVGPSNLMAYTATQQVVEHPAGMYNPLFIHGGCGLGKTHLLQAVCNGIRERQPSLQWRYVSGEQFTNDYIYAIKNRDLDSFRHRYRNVDVLVIDDVHFFASKKATQEEFLHTFNTVFTLGKQVVLSSDAHPKMIGHLSEHLVSRLVSGMVVRIDSPDVQVRMGVLSAAAKRMGVEVPEAVKHCIADSFRANIRELEGALLKVVAMAGLSGQPLTLSLAERALSELVRHTAPVIRLSDIETTSALFFGLTAGDLHTSRKTRTIALARSIAMYLARKHTKLSFPEIGKFMGNKNHSTVILASRRVSKMLQGDEEVAWCTPAGQKQMNLAVLITELEDQLGHRQPVPAPASVSPPAARKVETPAFAECVA